MYYNPDYNGIDGSRGWVCPKCGRVYSPSTPMCSYCNNTESITITATSSDYAEFGKYLSRELTDTIWDNLKKQWLNKE